MKVAPLTSARLFTRVSRRLSNKATLSAKNDHNQAAHRTILPRISRQQASPCYRGSRTKYTLHKPGCSCAVNKGGYTAASQDKECPACREAESLPYEMSGRELMWEQRQKHWQELEELHKAVEKDPYDALFGFSNRRLNPSRQRGVSAALKSELDRYCEPRAEPDGKRMQEWLATSKTVEDPIKSMNNRPNQRHEDCRPSEEKPEVQASLYWRTSGVDSAGRRFDETGDFVYDPVSNRMIPRHAQVEGASVELTDEIPSNLQGGMSRSSDRVNHQAYPRRVPVTKVEEETPEPVPREEKTIKEVKPTPTPLSNFKARFEGTKHSEAAFRKLREQSPSLASKNADSQASSVTAQHSQNYPSLVQRLSKNQPGSMQTLAQRQARQARTDAVTSIISEKLRSMQKKKDQENQLCKAEMRASLAGVKGDARRTSWLQKFLSSEAKSSSITVEPQPSTVARLEPSLERHVSKANRGPLRSKGPVPEEENLSAADTAVMQLVKSRERDLNAKKKALGVPEAEMSSKQSGRQTNEAPNNSENGQFINLTAAFNEAQQQTRRDEFRRKAENWARFKSEPPPRASSKPLTGSVSLKAQRPSGTNNIETTKQNRTPWQGIQDIKKASSLAFRKEKPLKSMNASELAAHKAEIINQFARRRSFGKAANVVDPKLEREINALKSAMTDFENRRRYRSKPEGTIEESYRTPNVSLVHRVPTEFLGGEGDMSPKVVDYAENGKWYKKKALHASNEEDIKKKDQQLVQEIREVYERVYGTIDVAHRQSNTMPHEHASFSERPVGFVVPPQQHKPTHTVNPVDGMVQSSPPTTRFIEPKNLADHDVPENCRTIRDEPLPNVSYSHSKSSLPQESSPQLPPSSTHQPKPSSIENHTQSRSGRYISPSGRRVRKQEPVFSGQLPAQRYTIPEIIQMLKQQGIASSPPPTTSTMSTSSSGNNNESSNYNTADTSTAFSSRDNDNHGRHGGGRRKRSARRFGRSLKFMFFTGTWIAGCCYATGVLIEYFRAPRVRDGYDQGRPTWDGKSGSWSRVYAPRPSRSEHVNGEKQTREATKQERKSVMDTPLRGLEYPLLGVLAACVWYLVSGGR